VIRPRDKATVTKDFGYDDLQAQSRRRWIEREGLRPTAPAEAAMPPEQQAQWDQWANNLINNAACALRVETQDFTGSLVCEVFALMRQEFRSEVDALVSGIEDEAVRAQLEQRLRHHRKQFRDAVIAERSNGG
jgi:hypothetical protein